jgi:hypothetical protein
MHFYEYRQKVGGLKRNQNTSVDLELKDGKSLGGKQMGGYSKYIKLINHNKNSRPTSPT